MDNFQIAEKYIQTLELKKLFFLAPTGFGKTTLLNKLLGLNNDNSPFAIANSKTTVSTQTIVISSSSEYSELYVKFRSEKDIVDRIEKNMMRGILEADIKNENEARDNIYVKIATDRDMEFPLCYSLDRDSGSIKNVIENILELKKKFHPLQKEELEQAVLREPLFKFSGELILAHIKMIATNIFQCRENTDLFFERGFKGFDDEGVWIRSKNLNSLLLFVKNFTGIPNQEKDKELLTPVVDLVRIKVAVNQLAKDSPLRQGEVEFCIIDTVGIGQKGAEISFDLLELAHKSDYVCIVQSSAEGGFNFELIKFLAYAASSGIITKLRLFFTKFDYQLSDIRFQNHNPEMIWKLAKNKMEDSLKTKLDSILSGNRSGQEDDYGNLYLNQKTYDRILNHLKMNTFFIGNLSSNDLPEGQLYNDNLFKFLKTLDITSQEELPPVFWEGTDVSLFFHEDTSKQSEMTLEGSDLSLERHIEGSKFRDLIDGFIKSEVKKYTNIQKKRGGWSTIKALSRRYSEKISTSWKGLDPVSTFAQCVQSEFKKQLDIRIADLTSEQEDEICQAFLAKLLVLSKEKLFYEANAEWKGCYNVSGDQKKRLQKIEQLFGKFLSTNNLKISKHSKQTQLSNSAEPRVSFKDKFLTVCHKENKNDKEGMSVIFHENKLKKQPTLFSLLSFSCIKFFISHLKACDCSEVGKLCDFQNLQEAFETSALSNFEEFQTTQNIKNDFATFLAKEIGLFSLHDFKNDSSFRFVVYNYLCSKDPGVWGQFRANKNDKEMMIHLISCVLENLRYDEKFIIILESHVNKLRDVA